VFVDALIIRSLLVPAIMHRIGPANWAMPGWLDHIVPNLSIETADETDHAPRADDSHAIPAGDDTPSDTPPEKILAGVSSPATDD
jgi:hypothetical protein